MYFSNVINYFEYIFTKGTAEEKTQKCKKLIDLFANYLKDNGNMIFAYFYAGKENVKELIDPNYCFKIYIKSMYMLEFENIMEDCTINQDMCPVYKKVL